MSGCGGGWSIDMCVPMSRWADLASAFVTGCDEAASLVLIVQCANTMEID